MSARAHIPLKEKLAAALSQMLRDDGNGKLVPIIPYDDAKQMTADQILSLFAWDHYPIRKVDGGADRHFNLVPRLIGEHRTKTATVDVPQMRKADRIRKRELGTKKPRTIRAWRRFNGDPVYANRER